MSSLLADTALFDLMRRTPWPDNVRLFQQYEVEQILMPEFASCLSVKAFLNMSQLKYQTELRLNAEFMSPTGELPFLQIGQVLVSSFDTIVAVANAKGHNLSKDLKDSEKAEMKAYISLVHNTLGNALQYILWCDKENRNLVTKPRYAAAHRWPLGSVLSWKKQSQVMQHLKAVGWASKTIDEVRQEVNSCFQALSTKLGSQQYFCAASPTELDAVVFGYLYTILTTKLPSSQLVNSLASYQNLNDFCLRVHDKYFKDAKILS